MQSSGRSYIVILKESLDKKIKVLDRILEQNRQQEEILCEEEIDYERFNKTIDEKAQCLKELESLDKGFKYVFSRVKVMLETEKEAYKQDIKELQEKIRTITDKSMDIQAGEARNKAAFQEKSMKEHKSISTKKTATKVAASYYKNMNKLNVVDAQFLDTKK